MEPKTVTLSFALPEDLVAALVSAGLVDTLDSPTYDPAIARALLVALEQIGRLSDQVDSLRECIKILNDQNHEQHHAIGHLKYLVAQKN